MRLIRWFVVVMALLALTAYACGGGGDDDDGGGGGSDGNGDNADITDTCDNNQFLDQLPDEVDEADEGDFPDDVPIYDGADFQCGYTSSEEGASGAVGIWSTGDSVEDVKAFYDEEFADGPWTSAGSGSAAGSTFWTISKGDEGGFVSVLSDGDDTAITIIIGDDFGDIGSGDDSSSGDDDSSSGDGDSSSGDDGSSGDDDSSSGNAELPDEQDLPDDFPSDVPLPDDIRVTSASTFSSGGVTSWLVEFYSQDSIDDLANHFKNEFEGQGWTQSFQTESDGEVFATYAESDDLTTGTAVTVNIVESDVEGYNTVSLSVTQQ